MYIKNLKIGEVYCLKGFISSYLYYYSKVGISDRKGTPFTKIVRTNEILDNHILIDKSDKNVWAIFKDNNRYDRYITIYNNSVVDILIDYKNTRLRNIELFI